MFVKQWYSKCHKQWGQYYNLTCFDETSTPGSKATQVIGSIHWFGQAEGKKDMCVSFGIDVYCFRQENKRCNDSWAQGFVASRVLLGLVPRAGSRHRGSTLDNNAFPQHLKINELFFTEPHKVGSIPSCSAMIRLRATCIIYSLKRVDMTTLCKYGTDVKMMEPCLQHFSTPQSNFSTRRSWPKAPSCPSWSRLDAGSHLGDRTCCA